MKKLKIRKFVIKACEEKGFVKFYLSHPEIKGRVRKHIGKGTLSDYEIYLIDIQKDIECYFKEKAITIEAVKDYLIHYIEAQKHVGSIFTYADEFVELKRKTFNRKTNLYLSKSSVNSYIKAIDNLKTFLKANLLSELPENINSGVLNDFFYSMLPLSHNYRAKLHGRLKEYLTYISNRKGVTIDESFKHSCFTEQYDNQQTDEDDRSLMLDEMDKLLMLRAEFKANLIQLPAYKKSKTIPEKLQQKQRETKINNLGRTLDCFLFMASTGMYISDINKIRITLRNTGNHSYISYRRAKNNSYCKGIPVVDKGCFIGKTILKEYSIKSNSNFPLNLSLNQFDKNLKIISDLARLDFKLTSKMARKTFASIYYFDYRINIGDIQTMLGHKEVRHTMHYLRINDDDFANRIHEQLNRAC